MTVRLGFASLAVALIAASAVFVLKDQVKRREGQLLELQARIAGERAKLNQLRAEWAMLNNPSRVARLAEQHLDLGPANPGQIVTINDIPFRLDLALESRRLRARLPSGGDVAFRLKPSRVALQQPLLDGGGP